MICSHDSNDIVRPELVRVVTETSRRLARDRSDADDLSQEVWLSALGATGAGVRSEAGWLRIVTQRRAAGLTRSRLRREDVEHLARHDRSRSTSLEDETIQDDHRRVRDAVDRLDLRYREVIRLRFFEGMALHEITATVRAPIETVRTRLKRGLAILRRRLAHE